MALTPEEEIGRLTRMPPGRHKLPADFVAQNQRARLSYAIVHLVARQGYPATSLNQVVKTAGVARHTFYEHFESKEALFLSVFDRAAEGALRVTREAIEAAPDPWEEKARAALTALLAHLAADLTLARVCLLESQSAGPEALARYEATLHEFADLLRSGRDSLAAAAEYPQSLEDITVGGLAWMVGRRLAEDPEGIEQLLPRALEFLLTPYVGDAAARLAAQSSD
ncbi:MAG TPA: TetR/AcrR family transcriptional regulator [Solirubrobacterales bacterium]|nr:TetR/AcrR family transcriptional regulator [Solirubrobacterales bacterium]